MLAYRGIVRAIGGGDFATYQGPPLAVFKVLNGEVDAFNNLFTSSANFRASTIWFILVAIIVSLVLLRTRFGNQVFAAGGAPEAASAQGVNVVRIKVICFMLAGLLAGIASVLQFAHRMSVDPLRGDGLELIVVAASVIGGVRLTGGYGTIFGAVMGTILLQTLDQGLVLMKIPIQVFQATAGLIIILAVISNTYLSKSD
jgi:simple sugar transport system permease protein